MDVTDIEAGVDFVDVLQGAVGSCGVLLAVIGHDWLTCTDRSGRRRLDDERDFIRLEIGTALARNVRVIPVLVEGVAMPTAQDLPADLEGLTRRQAVELRDARWNADVESLTSVLEPILKRKADGRPGVAHKSRPRPTLWLAAGAAAVGAVLVASIAIGLREGSAPPVSPKPAPGPAGASPPPPQPAPVTPVKPAEPAPSPSVAGDAPKENPPPRPSNLPAGRTATAASRGSVPGTRGPETSPSRSSEPSPETTSGSRPQPANETTPIPERPVPATERAISTRSVPAATNAKPVLVVRAFDVRPGVQWPYDLKQLQTATVTRLRKEEDVHTALDIVAEALSDAILPVYTLAGEVLSWQAGSRTKRLVIGLGTGRESADIRYWIVDGGGTKVFERKDTIRAALMGNSVATSAGQLAEPFVSKIAERLVDSDWPASVAPPESKK